MSAPGSVTAHVTIGGVTAPAQGTEESRPPASSRYRAPASTTWSTCPHPRRRRSRSRSTHLGRRPLPSLRQLRLLSDKANAYFADAGVARTRDPHRAFWLTVGSSDLVSGYSPTRPSTGCVEEQRLRSREPLHSVRRCSPACAVATGCCHRLRTQETGFEPKNGHFTRGIVAERQDSNPGTFWVCGFQGRTRAAVGVRWRLI